MVALRPVPGWDFSRYRLGYNSGHVPLSNLSQYLAATIPIILHD